MPSSKEKSKKKVVRTPTKSKSKVVKKKFDKKSKSVDKTKAPKAKSRRVSDSSRSTKVKLSAKDKVKADAAAAGLCKTQSGGMSSTH